MGHTGHRYLIEEMLEFRCSANYVYIGPKVGYDDPLSVGTRLGNLKRLNFPKITYSTWNETQTPLKKIEFELFASGKYDTILLVVGNDRVKKFIGYFSNKRIRSLQIKYGVKTEIKVIGLCREYVPVSSTEIRESIRNNDYSKMTEWFPQNDVWQNLKIINQVCYHKYVK